MSEALQIDTIVAVATPPGRGALATVRLSGPRTKEIVRRLLAPSDGAAELPPPRSARLAAFHDPESGALIDRGLLLHFEAPASYTGEDAAELTVHGGALVPALLLDACLRAGAREARGGEFTQRAYLNGKLDLVQAEAVRELVEAGSLAAHRAAVHQVEGGLSRRLAEVREGIVRVEALLVYHLDFPEEDEPPVPLARIVSEAGELAQRLRLLLATAPEGELLREGALLVLAGRPNSGKSSLFNALIGEERAIVTDQAGTTRDAIEARISLGGFPFRLVDTAGLREGSERIERIGIEVARRYLGAADLVLLCHPSGEEWGEEAEFLSEVRVGVPVLLLRTMSDLEGAEVAEVAGGEGATGAEGRGDGTADPSGTAPAEVVAPGADPQGAVGERVVEAIRLSTKSGEGISQLRERLPALLYSGLLEMQSDAPILTRRRQREAVARALEEVEAFAASVEAGVPVEAASAHLRGAESALEELLGVVSGEEILDRVFGDFCIGK